MHSFPVRTLLTDGGLIFRQEVKVKVTKAPETPEDEVPHMFCSVWSSYERWGGGGRGWLILLMMSGAN